MCQPAIGQELELTEQKAKGKAKAKTRRNDDDSDDEDFSLVDPVKQGMILSVSGCAADI